MTVECPAAKISHINAHLMTLSDEKNETMLLEVERPSKRVFWKNKGQSGPAPVISKTQGKRQLSAKF